MTILVLNAFCRRFITGGDRAPSRYIAQCAVCTICTVRNSTLYIVGEAFWLSSLSHAMPFNTLKHTSGYIYCHPSHCTVFWLSDWYHRVSLNRFNHIQENYDQMVLRRKPYIQLHFCRKMFSSQMHLGQYAEFEGSACFPFEIHLFIASWIKVPLPSVGWGQRLWLWVFERHRWEPRLCDQPRVWARNPPGGTIIFSLLSKRFHFLDFNALIFCV